MSYQSITDFKQELDPALISFLQKKVVTASTYTSNPLLNHLTEHVLAIYQGGGKRLRPYMAYLGYVTTGGTNPSELLLCFGAFEIFHLFILMHDDIIDHGMLRHDVRTLHQEALAYLKKENRLGDLEHVANSHAMIVGDILSTWGYELFATAGPRVGYEVASRAQQRITPFIEEVAYGEMLDIDTATRASISDQEVDDKTYLKTATYSFIRPAQAGIALGPQADNQELMTFAETYGRELGIGFQIQDDYLDIVGNAGKNTMADAAEHQHTVYTQFIRNNGTAAEKALLESHLGRHLTPEEVTELQDLYQTSGAIEYGLSRAHNHFEKSKEAVEQSSLSEEARIPWMALIEMVEHRSR